MGSALTVRLIPPFPMVFERLPGFGKGKVRRPLKLTD